MISYIWESTSFFDLLAKVRLNVNMTKGPGDEVGSPCKPYLARVPDSNPWSGLKYRLALSSIQGHFGVLF